MFQTKPEMAADIDALAERLASLSVGETASYDDLTKVVGRDIRDDFYALRKARTQAERRLGCLFEVVRAVGIKRLAPQESLHVGSQVLGTVRRAARRGIDRIARIRSNSLEPGDQSKLIAYQSQLGAIAYTADRKRTDEIAKAEPSRVLPVGKVLEMFK